jgi:NADH-quinone oxidoreductase subunit M
MLVLYKKTFFGPLTNEKNKNLSDVKGRELAALVPLVMLVVYLGVYPKPILGPVDKSVTKLVEEMNFKIKERKLREGNPLEKTKIDELNTIGEAK